MEPVEKVNLKIATPITRLFGHIIDWGIGAILFMLAFGSIGVGVELDSSGGTLFGLILLIGYFILSLYCMSKSTSIGKSILGLKVYKIDTRLY